VTPCAGTNNRSQAVRLPKESVTATWTIRRRSHDGGFSRRGMYFATVA
jgi:hypothetical protein